MQTFLFLKLSIVKHFPKAVVHTKKVTLEESSASKCFSKGKTAHYGQLEDGNMH